MVNFTINVISEKEDKRIPAALAGQVMVDIQDLFTHIGEYLVAKELRLQSILDEKFDEKFRIYMDDANGISFGASTSSPVTEGRGNIIDDAVALMEKTMDMMGNGTGSYWMEDVYADALYRNAVIYDIVALFQDINDKKGYALMYGSGEELKRFGTVDIEKLSNFIRSKGLSYEGAMIGTIGKLASKSSKEGRYTFTSNGNTVRIVFANDEERSKAEKFVNKGAVIIAGVMTFNEDGALIGLVNAGGLQDASELKFRRMVSVTGDVMLKEPLTAKVKFDDGKWTLSNDDLGMVSSKDTWDSAVQSFHDYFIFLWTQYADRGDEGLSEEELEVKKALLALIA